MECSALTGENIKQIFQNIVNLIDNKSLKDSMDAKKKKEEENKPKPVKLTKDKHTKERRRRGGCCGGGGGQD